jgi:hypothetical protein
MQIKNGIKISPGVIIRNISNTIILEPATTPTLIALTSGTSNPVGNVVNVSVPAANDTDTTGRVTGWSPTTANRIRFRVVDGGAATSTIVINNSLYTNNTNYTIANTGNLTVVVSTSESNKTTVTRTFIIPVAAVAVGDSYGGGIYIGTTRDINNVVYNLILSPFIQFGEGITDVNAGNRWPMPNGNILGTSEFDGLQNTNYIPTTPDNSTGGVANYFGDLVSNGYSDWYWPAKNELETIASVLRNNQLTDEQAGFLKTFRYWSSTTLFTTLFNPTRFIYFAWAMDSDTNKTIFQPRVDGTNSAMLSGRARCVRRQLP